MAGGRVVMSAFYRVLLRLYPKSFRQEYGDEMAHDFARACAGSGPLRTLRLLIAAVADIGPNAVAVHWSILRQDLRYTARTWNRGRGFALTAILVTALGVGANTAALSVADFVLLRPLPFPDADAIVRLCEGPREGGGWGCNNQLSPANYRDFKTRNSSVTSMGAFGGYSMNLVGIGEPRRIEIATVTPELLPVLGVAPMLGRVFSLDDRDRDAVVISYGLWQSQFGGDRGVIGRLVRLDGGTRTIIGVMPRGFYFPNRETEMWSALTFAPEDYAARDNSYIEGVGRLMPGVTFEQARADFAAIARRLAEQYPDTNGETGISFYRMRENMSPRFRTMLLALVGASLSLLLLACANLANLLLARAASRERELAVRAALGAGRERLVRQLITESVALALLGGVAGIGVAAMALPMFASLVPPTLPVANQPALDLRVLAIALLSTAVIGLGFALFPALRGGRSAFAALRDGTRTGGGRTQRVRTVLVTMEVMLSVALLITSGLLMRAVWRVQAIEPGFVAHNVLTLRTALPRPKYENPARRGQFYERVLTEVRALPGVQSAGFISGLPIVVPALITGIEVPGQPVRNYRAGGVSHRWITPQYFEAMGIPLLRGRDVETTDTTDRPWVAVVSASFAARYWPNQDPLGKTFKHLRRERTVIGVVGDVKVRGLERTSEPQLYVPAWQCPEGLPAQFDPKDLAVRYAGRSNGLINAIRQVVRAADVEQPISNVRSMDEVLASVTADRRTQLQLLGSFAVVAVLLCGVGIFGLLAYSVALRSKEIGIRLALGAERSRVARMVLADGMRLAVIGSVPGAIAAYFAGRAMQALLFGVAPGDPMTFIAAIVSALLMAFAGSFLPVLRAVRVSPTLVLRAD
jgi:putative ABC transport system permease protein